MSEYMAILWGILPEGDRQEILEEIDSKKIEKELESRMSTPINAETFVSDILQMYVYGEDNLSAGHSKELLSKKTQQTDTSLLDELVSNGKYAANSTQTEWNSLSFL